MNRKIDWEHGKRYICPTCEMMVIVTCGDGKVLPAHAIPTCPACGGELKAMDEAESNEE